MAIVTRYFSTSSAGTGDGTSWANRAAFIVSGTLNMIITNQDYSGNSMVCYVQGGAYTTTGTWQTGLFAATPPGIDGYLSIQGCDSSGNPLTPDYGWDCADPDFDTSAFPVITFSGVSAYINALGILFKCVKLVNLNRSGPFINNCPLTLDYCCVDAQNSNTATVAVACTSYTNIVNSIIKCSGTSFDGVVTAGVFTSNLDNVKIVGNSSASTGNRYGLRVSTGGIVIVQGLCIVNCPGYGLVNISTATGATIYAARFTIDNCGVGIGTLAATGGVSVLLVANSYIANCTTGLHQVRGYTRTNNVRLRNTTNFNITPVFPYDAYVAAGSDADEYVNKAGGNYRMKSGSTYFGKHIGVRDEVVSGGGGGGLAIGRLISGGV